MESVVLLALAAITCVIVAPPFTAWWTASVTPQAESTRRAKTVRAVPWLSWSSISAALRVVRAPGCVHALTASMCQHYGRDPRGRNGEAAAFALRIPGWRRQLVVLSSPSSFEDVLRKEFASFPKGEYQCENMRDLLGSGIFAADGDTWKRQRKTASRLFTARALRESMAAVVQRHASTLIRELGKHADKRSNGMEQRSTVDLFELFNQFTFDVFPEIGFGVSNDSLSTADTADDTSDGSIQANTVFREFQRAFDSAQRVIARRFIRPTWLWKTLRWLNVGLEAQLKRDLYVIDTTAAALISECLGNSAAETGARKLATIVSLLLGDRHLTDSSPDHNERLKKELRDAVVNFMLAGRDTTAQTLTWFFYCLLRNPRVEFALREALRSRSDTASNPIYLEAALRETLRLYPPVPFTTKDASRDVVLSDGTPIRAGTTVGLAFYAMGRDRYVWGEDADQFRPERWLEASTDGRGLQIKGLSAFMFTAFNAGSRTCLGANLATLELKTVATMLLRTFRFELELTLSGEGGSDGLEVSPDLALTLPRCGGLRVRIRRSFSNA